MLVHDHVPMGKWLVDDGKCRRKEVQLVFLDIGSAATVNFYASKVVRPAGSAVLKSFIAEPKNSKPPLE